MNAPHSATIQKPRKRRWPRNLLITFGLVTVLLVTAWFVVTSTPFFKRIILPRAGKALNASVTVQDASIKPFKEIELHKLKVQPRGTEPVLLEARQVRVRYDLWAMLGGDVVVRDILIDSPVLTIVENADGSRNVDPLMKPSPEPGPSEPPSAADQRPRVVLGAFNLTNATLHYIRNRTNGLRDQFDVTGLNIALNDVRNGQEGRLRFAFGVTADLNPPDPAQRGSFQAAHSGSYTFTLGQDLVPTRIEGSDRLRVLDAQGALAELAGFRATSSVSVSPAQIDQVLLSLLKDDVRLGELRVSGPFDATTREGTLTVLLTDLDHHALNLAGAFLGVDFGSTSINSSNTLSVTRGAQALEWEGRLDITNLTISRAGRSTPVLDLGATYGLSMDSEAGWATVSRFTLRGAQNKRHVLESELSQPMVFSWKASEPNVSDSILTLELSRLPLSDWQSVVGENASGELSATLNLLSQQAGQLLSFDLSLELRGLQMSLEGLGALDSKLKIEGRLTAFETLDLTGFQLQTTEAGRALAAASGSATYEGVKSNMSAQVNLSLTSTPRAATNAASLEFSLDMSDPTAMTGRATLTAGTLDLTDLMDRFPGRDEDVGAAASGDAASVNAVEPEPTSLPLRDYSVQAQIGRLWLREIEISDLEAGGRLNGAEVRVEPVGFALNDAPVTGTARLNMGVRGWEYGGSLVANGVPVAPFADSFLPEYREAASGRASAEIQFEGLGITTPNLVKSLSGRTRLGLEDASVRLATQPRTATGRTLRNVVLVIGKALRLPEILDAPIASFGTDATLQAGQLTIGRLELASQSFRLRSAGTVSLSQDMRNSTINGFPVELSLSPSLAQQAGLAGSTGTNHGYVDLGRLATVTGTLDEPNTRLDLARIGLLTARGIGSMESIQDTDVGKVLQSLGGLLENTGQTNQVEGTNAPDTSRQQAVGNVIRGIGGLIQQRREASTNSPAPSE